MARRLMAEFLGTAILVFIGAGAATLVFGFHVFGFRSASSVAAGVLTVGMAFGLVLLALVLRDRAGLGLPRQPGGDARRAC